MIEASIGLEHLQKIDFVDHHKNYCSVHRHTPSKCPELGQTLFRGGAVFLTRAVVTRADLSQLYSHFVIKDGKPSNMVELAYNDFVSTVSRKIDFSGTLTEGSDFSITVMRAIMSAFTFGSIEDAKVLCALFKDKTSFINEAAMVFADKVGLTEWQELANS